MNSNSPSEPEQSKVEKMLFRKKYQNWATEDAILWLEEILRLPQYKENFVDLALDGTMMDFITDEDLENDGKIKVRLHRVKIIEGIKKLKQNQTTVVSSPRLAEPSSQMMQLL